MSGVTVQVHRQSPRQSWGFRLQGGRDFREPLSVKTVTNGSPAAAAHLGDGDSIIAIGNYDASQLTHSQASQMISGSGTTLQLTVHKGAVRSLRPSGPIKFSAGKAYQHGY